MASSNPMSPNKKNILRWMQREVEQCIYDKVDAPDEYVYCGEVQCGLLAEDAAIHFGHDEWLDDPDHWIWDLPVDIANKLGM